MAAGTAARPGQARRRARSRAALLGAARELLVEGSRDASIEAITKRAGVGFGTFFNHFATKDELFEEATLEALDEYAAWAREATADLEDPAEIFARSFRLTLRLAATAPAAFGPLLSAGSRVLMADRDLRRNALTDLRLGVEQGRFADITPEVLLAAVSGALLGLAQLTSVSPETVPDEAGDEIVAGILRLLGLDPVEADDIAHRPLPDEYALTPGT